MRGVRDYKRFIHATGLTMNVIRPFVLVVCFLFLLHSATFTQVIDGRFSTSIYAWERFDTVGQSMQIARAYENVQFNAASDNLSFHTYFHAASDVSQSVGDEALIRIDNVFFRWKDIAKVVDVNVGRVPVFAGVGAGTVDGALVKLRGCQDRITLTGYGGANVLPDLHSPISSFSDVKDNFFVGGQVVGRFVDGSRISLSYSNKLTRPLPYTAIRPDSVFNPMEVFVVPETRREQFIGADASYSYRRCLSAYGRYDYDVSNKRSLRGELFARVYVLSSQLALTGDFNYREPRIWYNSFFSFFPISPSREYEGGVEYAITPWISTVGRFAYVQYTTDKSRRLTIGLNTRYGNVRLSSSDGYAGELNSVYVEGMYPLLDRKLTPTVGLSCAQYRLLESTGQLENLYSASIGAVVRPIPSFSVDAQLQVLRNAIVSSDVRGFGRVSYWFSHSFSAPQLPKEVGE
jgi:hypothetical protein